MNSNAYKHFVDQGKNYQNGRDPILLCNLCAMKIEQKNTSTFANIG